MRFCPLASGSSGNATYLELDGVRLLIDVGLSAKRITELLHAIGAEPSKLDAILVTHEHVDHIRGVNTLSKRFDLPVFANAACHEAMRFALSGVQPGNIRVFESDAEFRFRTLRILPFSIPHDAAHPVGYVISGRTQTVAVCTDLGRFDERILERLKGADAVLLEANHDVDMLMAGRYPYATKRRILSGIGHLCNEDCANAVVKLYEQGVKRIVLGHMSLENNDPDLAMVTVRSALKLHGLDACEPILANRESPTEVDG